MKKPTAMMHFAKMEEGWEWEWTQQDHLEEVIITPENTHTYLQVTHRIIEIVELVIESIKVDIILLINHLGSYHLYLDKLFPINSNSCKYGKVKNTNLSKYHKKLK